MSAPKLTVAQRRALEDLTRHGRTWHFVADVMSTSMARKLESLGLVTYQRGWSARRASSIALTDAGRAALKDGGS